jgi:hypothetical protein
VNKEDKQGQNELNDDLFVGKISAFGCWHMETSFAEGAYIILCAKKNVKRLRLPGFCCQAHRLVL